MSRGTVVQVARTLPWHLPGGMETHSWELAKALARRGWTVEVITSSFGDQDVEEEREGIRIHSLRHLPRNRERLPTWRWWSRFARRVREYAVRKEFRPDVVHSESAYGHAWFGALARGGDRPARVMTLHGTGWRTYEETGRPRLLERVPTWHPRAMRQWAYERYRRILERRRELPSASRWVAVSEALRLHLAQDYRLPADRIDVVPNGVNVPDPVRDPAKTRRELGLPNDCRVVLYVGRLEPSKRVDRLVEHAARAPGDLLVVVGEGSAGDSLRDLAVRLGAAARVRFLGFVSEEQKMRLLGASDVFALASDSEGQPITLIEALAAGLPVYARRPWVPADLEPLVATGDDVAAGLDEAVRRGRNLRARRESLVGSYSWDRVAERYEAVFAKALG